MDIKLYALMHKENGQWKLAHRIKRSHSVYSSPNTHRPLVYDTAVKAQRALNKTTVGNYMPEGTVVVELIGKVEKQRENSGT